MRNVLMATVMTLLAGGASAQVVETGEDVIREMRARYDGRWYTTLRFVQKSTFYAEDGSVGRVETWYESMELPGLLRIDIAPLTGGRSIVFRNDTLYNAPNGTSRPGRATVHPLLLMGFDVYHLPVDETLGKLEGLGVDLDKMRETKWLGRGVWVLGAEEGDIESHQFWIDKERMVFVRQLRGSNDTRFNAYERIGDAWISPEVVFLTDGRRTLLEEYSEMEVGLHFEDGVFDPERLLKPAWTPAGDR